MVNEIQDFFASNSFPDPEYPLAPFNVVFLFRN